MTPDCSGSRPPVPATGQYLPSNELFISFNFACQYFHLPGWHRITPAWIYWIVRTGVFDRVKIWYRNEASRQVILEDRYDYSQRLRRKYNTIPTTAIRQKIQKAG
jgi:hypothetical protein